ncbi:MAG: T9SS type A sorting domain-containing protein [Bacteroidetes bacterium]|nr:T9SS type A sorting domain-containing protein [Bacteroidota bacterium]
MDVVFSTETEGTAVVQIFNSQGQVVLSKKVDLHEGVNRLPISLDSFIKGVYFVTLENGLEIQKTRLVKE